MPSLEEQRKHYLYAVQRAGIHVNNEVESGDEAGLKAARIIYDRVSLHYNHWIDFVFNPSMRNR